MSRHRTVRSMNYQDEYDGYDDVYGHSVEDESYCVSPSTAAQFLYDRSNQPSLSCYMTSQEIPEEDEDQEDQLDEGNADSLHDSFHLHQLGLSPTDEVRLKGCLDEMRNILGESVPENVMVAAILKSNFDSNAAADDVLGQQTDEVPKPQMEQRDTRRNRDEAQSRPIGLKMSTTQSTGPVICHSCTQHRLLPLTELSLRRIIILECPIHMQRNACMANYHTLKKRLQKATRGSLSSKANMLLEHVKESISKCKTTMEESELMSLIFDYAVQSENRGISSEQNDKMACKTLETALMVVVLSHIHRHNLEALLVMRSIPQAKLCTTQFVVTPPFSLTKDKMKYQKATDSAAADSSEYESQSEHLELSESAATVSSSLLALAAKQHLSGTATSCVLSSATTESLAAMASQHISGRSGCSDVSLVATTSQPLLGSHTAVGSSSTTDTSRTVCATAACGESLLPASHFSGPLVTARSSLAAMASKHLSGPGNSAMSTTQLQRNSGPLTMAQSSLAAMASRHLSGPTHSAASTAITTTQHNSGPLTSSTPSLTMLATQHRSGSLTSVSSESLPLLSTSDGSSLTKLASQHLSGPVKSAASATVTASQQNSGPLTSATPSLTILAKQHRSVSSEHHSQPLTSDGVSLAKMASRHISGSPSSVRSSLAMMASQHLSTGSESARLPLAATVSEPSSGISVTGGLSLATLASCHSTTATTQSHVTSRPVNVAHMLDSIYEVSPVYSPKAASASDLAEKPKVKPPPGFHMSTSHALTAQFCGSPAALSNVPSVIPRPPPGFQKRKQAVDLRQLLGVAAVSTPCSTQAHDSLPRCAKEHRRRMPGQMFAKPSLFGATLCTSYKPRDCVQKPKCALQFPKFSVGCLKSLNCEKLDEISRFEFLTPSPDDIVKEKQKAAFINPGERARQELQRTTAPLSVTLPPKVVEGGSGLTPSVARMTFTGVSAQSELDGSSDGTRPKAQRVENITKESGEKTISMRKSGSSSNLEDGGKTGETPGKSGTKSKVGKLDLVKEYERRRASDDKENLNMVVIGHVDAGKSTLMGHVLYQLGFVNKKTMHKYEQESRKLGKASFAYAWVLDETDEERSRGVTMDVAQTRFETNSKMITLLDAPGHKDFIPNMITGAAQADVAILVVNATRGEFETGFESGGQTREHAMLIRSLGVSQLGVAINKMDTVGWSRDRYEEIVKKLAQFLKQAGFKDNDIAYIPCSGLAGENLTASPTVPALATWYSGPTLVQQIDNFKLPERQVGKPLRMCVVDVFKGMGSGFSVSGIIHAGAVQPGDRLLVMPQGEMLTVKGVLIDDLPMQCAFAGDSVVLTVTGIDMSNVTVGSILCLPSDPIKAVTRFRARIVLLNIDVPITKGFPVVFHYLSTSEPAHIHKLVSLLHKSTGEVMKKKPRCLVKNSSAVIELQLDRPVCIELYKDYKALGRFMLRYAGSTIAAGLITEITAKKNDKE